MLESRDEGPSLLKLDFAPNGASMRQTLKSSHIRWRPRTYTTRPSMHGSCDLSCCPIVCDARICSQASDMFLDHLRNLQAVNGLQLPVL
jgi:hypothetical protein